MEIAKPAPPVRTLKTFLEQVALSGAFGFFGYVILFFIAVSLIYPTFQMNEEIVRIFWPTTIAFFFAFEVWIARTTLGPLRERGLRGGFMSASLITFLLIAASPLLFSDESVRESLFTFTLLLVTPFLGCVIGGWFVSRRAA